MINETITLDAGEAVSQADLFAASLERADEKFAALEGRLRAGLSMGGGSGGADKLAQSMEAAATKIDRAAARIAGTFDKIAMAGDKMSAAGAGADKLAAQLAGVGDAGKSAAAGIAAAADETKGLAAGLGKVSESGKGAGDSLKGLGDTTKRNSAWLAEYNAEMKAAADMQKRFALSSAETSRVVARSQSLQTASARQFAVDATAARRVQAGAAEASAAAAEASSHRWKMAGLGAGAVIAYGVDQAAKLQAGITRLYTTAGESQKNLPMIEQGILKLAPETATSQAQLLQGAYMAESAGFHGKSALNVLKAGAEGAFAEGAPLGDTINALTSMLNAYGMKGAKAPTAAMDQIISMVSRGKMTMSGAVSALPTVLPVAAQAGLGFGQVGGALATMTAMGTSPDLAAQHLAHTIGSLQNMSGVQTKEIQQLGGDPVKLEKNLGKTGLIGTLTQINDLVTGSMGKSGTVLMKTFNQSASAAADANRMLNAMPPSLRDLGKAYLDNSITQKQWMADLKGLPPLQANLEHQFATVANHAKGFNDLLKSGSPAAQTYEAALSKALGGQTGLQTFLSLMGIHQPAARANTQAVTQAGKRPGSDVTGWPEVQHTLKFQLGSAEQALQSVATQIGKAFLPMATTGLKDIASIGKFFAGHPALTKDLAEIGGGALGLKLAKQFGSALLRDVGRVGQSLKIPGMDKMANLGKDTGLTGAATGLGEAAGGLRGAATALTEAAGKLAGESVLPGGPGGGKPGTPGAARTAERDAARAAEREAPKAGNILSKLGRVVPKIGELGMGVATGPVGWGIAITDMMVKPFLSSLSSGPGGKNWWENPFGMAGPHDRGSANNWLSSFSPYERLFHTGGTPNAGTPVYNAPSGAAFRVAGPSAPAAAARVAPVKIPPPDTSALDAARMKIQATLQTIGSGHPVKPIKIPPPDMSALDGAKAKALSAGEGIQQAAQAPLHKPVKASTPDLSAYRAAVGPAAADGAAVSAGFAGGIEAGKGAAVAAASDVASAAAAAMAHTIQSHSPSRVTHREGENFTAGFERGIKSRAHHVKAAVAGLSASAITSLTQGLQGGKSAIDAAMQAITGKGSRPQDITTIAGTITTLEGKVSAALKSKQVGLGQGTALTAMLQMDNQRLQQLAAKRAMLEQEITDSTQIAQSAVSSASIVTAGQGSYTRALAGGPIAAAQTLQGMQMMAGDQSQFASTVKQLQKAGLNSTSLDQIIQSGAQQGLPVALGLLQGGKGAISQANTQEKSILKSASALGDVGGPAMYQAGAQLGQEAASGLKSALGAVDAAMKQIAQQLVADVDKALHIPAPHGGHAAPRRLAPLHPAPHGGGHGGTVVHNVTVHLNVQGSVSTERDLVSHIQEHVLTRANNNWQTGWRHPGRAA